MAATSDLRYPIGRYQYTAPNRVEWLAQVAELPAELRAAVAGLNDRQLDTPYRDGGWTVRQVIHHVADSHVNSYVRFRLALTENEPTIRPYDEKRWAELADAKTEPIDVSLKLIEAIHTRWVRLLSSISEQEWQQSFFHPVNGRMSLDFTIGLYAWHGRHHVAHIKGLRERMGW